MTLSSNEAISLYNQSRWSQSCGDRKNIANGLVMVGRCLLFSHHNCRFKTHMLHDLDCALALYFGITRLSVILSYTLLHLPLNKSSFIVTDLVQDNNDYSSGVSPLIITSFPKCSHMAIHINGGSSSDSVERWGKPIYRANVIPQRKTTRFPRNARGQMQSTCYLEVGWSPQEMISYR